jgi:HNH endonuclease
MKDIFGFEGTYAVTQDGKVWSYPKLTKMPNGRGIREDGNKWITPLRGQKRTTHQRVYLHKDGKTFGISVHRLVAQAYIENPLNYPFVNHIDGNPLNNNITNLEWCTAKHNSKHAYDTGLIKIPHQFGANNSNAKLTNNDIVEIRKYYKDVNNSAMVARKFNINARHAWAICNNRAWTHI